MELKQMVYVVIENGYVTGVWNEYQDAESHVGEDGVIIPAVVDTYGERAGCETPKEVIEAMEQELQNLYPSCEDDDDDDDEEEDDDDDDDDNDDDNDDDDGLTDHDINELLKMLLN